MRRWALDYSTVRGQREWRCDVPIAYCIGNRCLSDARHFLHTSACHFLHSASTPISCFPSSLCVPFKPFAHTLLLLCRSLLHLCRRLPFSNGWAATKGTGEGREGQLQGCKVSTIAEAEPKSAFLPFSGTSLSYRSWPTLLSM